MTVAGAPPANGSGALPRSVRIAVAQYAPHVGDLEGNRAAAVRWATDAADWGADLVVLPELASSGYTFESLEEAEGCAEDATDGPFVTALAEVARARAIHIVSGLCERAGGRRHNSAVAIGPAGPLATYRKLHLFNDEKTWFAPGEGLRIVDTPFGRVGMVVCYDIWFPEAIRTLALGGAEIIAVPTNWVSAFKPRLYDERGYCQGDYVAMVTASQSGVAIACADRVGTERGLGFLGASIIVGPDGWAVAGPAGAETEELLVGGVDMTRVDAARRRTPRNHLLEDRRPEAYTVLDPGQEARPASTGARGEPV